MLHPIGPCYVDDDKIEEPVALEQGNDVRFGDVQCFRFNHPTEALRLRKLREAGAVPASSTLPARARKEAERMAAEKAKIEEQKVRGCVCPSFTC